MSEDNVIWGVDFRKDDNFDQAFVEELRRAAASPPEFVGGTKDMMRYLGIEYVAPTDDCA